jgi:hypothetical protein
MLLKTPLPTSGGVNNHKRRTIIMLVVPLSSYDATQEYHTVPKGVTALLSLLSNFKLGKIIAIYSGNNSKHLNNPKP